MANIGTFTADKDGFAGTLRTLTLNVKVKLVPNDKGSSENAPDFRLQAASHAIGGLMVPVPGGVLIKDSSGTLLGAIGISGDTADNDELCAVAAIEAAGLLAETGT